MATSSPAWEKVLWRRQPFPDDHVPLTFLAELSRLPPRIRPRLRDLFIAALPITQHITVIALFTAIFYALLEGDVGPAAMGVTCAAAGVMGYLVNRLGWAKHVKRTHDLLPPASPLRPLILPPLLLALLSPVLGTLTSATTSDSIWPLAGGLFFVHLLLADFTTGPDERLRRWRRQARARQRAGSVGHLEEMGEKSLSSSLSLTSALSASVVLSSRLPSTAHVFSLVLLSVELFAGWPRIAKQVREAGRGFSLGLTLSTILLTISLLPTAHSHGWLPHPSGPTLMFLMIIGMSNGVGPVALWYGWRWKTRRGGDWDVARVRVRKEAGR